MKSEQDNRRSTRINHITNIRVKQHGSDDSFLAMMIDFSDHGVYVKCSAKNIPDAGSCVQIKSTEFEGASWIDAKVIRAIDRTGFAIDFQS